MSDKYQLWTMTAQDMLNEGIDPMKVVQMERFKVLMQMGASIESITVMDLDQDLDGTNIISNLCLDIVVAGETFHVFVSVIDDQLVRGFILFHRVELALRRTVLDYFGG